MCVLSFPVWFCLKLVHRFLFTEASLSYSEIMDDEYAKFIRRTNPSRYVILTPFFVFVIFNL